MNPRIYYSRFSYDICHVTRWYGVWLVNGRIIRLTSVLWQWIHYPLRLDGRTDGLLLKLKMFSKFQGGTKNGARSLVWGAHGWSAILIEAPSFDQKLMCPSHFGLLQPGIEQEPTVVLVDVSCVFGESHSGVSLVYQKNLGYYQ